MEWYLPFTLISGVGLIVLSTSNILLNLNTEISEIASSQLTNKETIIELKLSQLRLLGNAIVLEYTGLFLFVISSLAISLFKEQEQLAKIALLVGVIAVGIALALLIIYSYRSISIRQKHLNHE